MPFHASNINDYRRLTLVAMPPKKGLLHKTRLAQKYAKHASALLNRQFTRMKSMVLFTVARCSQQSECALTKQSCVVTVSAHCDW